MWYLLVHSILDQLRPFLDDSAGGFVERLFEALEESRSSRGNKGGGEKNRKRDLKVSKHPITLCTVTAKLNKWTLKLIHVWTIEYTFLLSLSLHVYSVYIFSGSILN